VERESLENKEVVEKRKISFKAKLKEKNLQNKKNQNV